MVEITYIEPILAKFFTLFPNGFYQVSLTSGLIDSGFLYRLSGSEIITSLCLGYIYLSASSDL